MWSTESDTKVTEVLMIWYDMTMVWPRILKDIFIQIFQMENRKCRPTATKEMGRPHQGPTVVISNIEKQE